MIRFAWTIGCIVPALAPSVALSQCAVWLPGQGLGGLGGVGGASVRAVTLWDPDGDGPAQSNTVAGGWFTLADGRSVSGVAAWDGAAWRTLGQGFDSTVVAVSAVQGELYAAGWFTRSGDTSLRHIARWDGTQWQPVGAGFDSAPLALLEHNGELVAGGAFERSGKAALSHIARWTGVEWRPIGGGVSVDVGSMVHFNGELVVSGTSRTGGAGAVLAFDGSTWRSLNIPHVQGSSALVVHAGELYAGDSSFSTPIQRWNGASWTAVRSAGWDTTGQAHALASFGGQLYAGGYFTNSGITDRCLLRFDGTNWRNVGGGVASRVRALVPTDAGLILGGDFGGAGGVAARHVAVWTGSEYRALGEGITSGRVQAMMSRGDDLILGGAFRVGSDSSSLAAWDGVSTRSMGRALGNGVFALTTFDDDLLIGGGFTQVDGTFIHYLARWDGRQWYPMNQGISIDPTGLQPIGVYDFGLYQGVLIAGGSFTPGSLARWNGASWESIGTGVWRDGRRGAVYSIQPLGDDLVIAGLFDHADQTVATNIARWDGATWRSFGEGLAGGASVVRDVVVYADQLYACGSFDHSGTTPLRNLARWTGSEWVDVGGGLDGPVYAMIVHNGELIVGGSFTRAGEVAAARVARWDGKNWASIDLGLDASKISLVQALHVHREELIVGGEFSTVSGVPSNFWARWSITGAPWIAHQPADREARTGASVQLAVAPASCFEDAQVEWTRDGHRVVDGPGGAAAGGGIVAGASSATLSIANVTRADAGQYRARLFNDCGEDTSQPAQLVVLCAGDLDRNGQVTSADFFLFLTAYFEGEPAGDFNRDGTLSSADVFDFLTAFFEPCT